MCIALLAVCGALLQGCSAVKLAYNQVPHLAYWQLNWYLDLSETQTEHVRSELGDLHQWHRDTMLPRHAELLQKVQQQLPAPISPTQACRAFDEARIQLDKVLAQAEPKLVTLALQLTDAQIRNLEKKQADSNADWRKEWLEPSPEQLREQRYKRHLSRAEMFYGTLEEPQKAVLRAALTRSSFDPQRNYAERVRRQKDLLQVLQKVAQDRNNTEQARALLRGYMARFATSPDVAYQRYAQTQVEEGCETFSRMHNATTAGQRLKAVQSLKGYEQDFWLLAAQ
ncbi:MAG: hypothetical protein A3F76_11570 [Burkholderiales bacterium RIFCSPLOWO2_12_FULL_65_40]|nr:MAG: hypothetical protein A3F76_11570 [Burkholderiales bacterium RIFCSPLOWO2_12_FULL_65_40]